MLETHLPQVEALLRDGVVVRSAPRPVRLMLGCDYAAQCNVVGHKSATATQPCLCCKRTRWPRKKQAVLDALFGTLQDITRARCTLGRRCILLIGWSSMARHRWLGSPVHLSTSARLCGVLCLLQICGKTYQFHCTPRKE